MDRSRIGRAVAILAVAALAVAVVSPAFSAAPVTKAKVKKLAKKAVKQNIDDFGNPIFIEETELVRWGPVTMNVAEADKPIGTFGPFSLTAHCADDGAGNIDAEVLLTTTEAHSAFQSDDDSDDDFNPGDPDNPAYWARDTGGIIVGGPPEINSENDEDAHAIAPSGFSIAAGQSAIGTNFGGFDCWFTGAILVVAPQ